MSILFLYKTLLYAILLCFLGFVIGTYLSNFKPIREGARTLPRPVINPAIKENEFDIKPLPPYHGETINQMIDRYIATYFDKRGFPYTNTISIYSTKVSVGGAITPDNKSKLTDIGYYLLNVVIPNIQTVDNPIPTISWTPIKWTGNPTFPIQYLPTPTYQIYNGQSFESSYASELNNESNSGDASGNESGYNSENASGNASDNASGNASGNASSDGSGVASKSCGGNNNNNECRITCPENCLNSVLTAMAENNSKNEKENENENENENGYNEYMYNYWLKLWNTKWNNNTSKMNGVSSLPGGPNQFIIGSTEIDGYQITDISITTEEPSPLNQTVNEFINKYFIESGPNQYKPTEYAISEFNLYFQNKTPMDNIHMNKMRDIIYYVLQTIIPGLPINAVPRAYVEWRPIKWLSRSEIPSM
jgi:hypothetical protein